MFYRAVLSAAVLLIAASVTPVLATTDQRLVGYMPVDLSSWQPRTAPSVMALVEQLYRGHPEAVEGRPTLKIDLRRDSGDAIVVDIEMRGYLDHSVDGEDFRAFVIWTEKGWRLDALGVRYICSGGETPGVPVTTLCP